MLKGTFKYNDIEVLLEGYDSGSEFVFYVTCLNSKHCNILDKGFDIETFSDDGMIIAEHIPINKTKWWVSVTGSAINVSRYQFEENGKKFNNSPNIPYFKLLGSLLRGFKNSCYTVNRDDYFDLIPGEFAPRQDVSYTVKIEQGLTGYIKTVMGLIKRIEVIDDNNEIDLYLEEDNKYNVINKLTNLQNKIPLDLKGFERKVEEASWFEDAEINGGLFSLEDIINRNPEKSYSWLKKRDYQIVTDIEDVKKVVDEIWNWEGVVAFDTETTGLAINFKSRTGEADRLVGMVFSIRPGQAWYFPVAHKKIDNICTEANEAFIIEKYFKPILEKKDILCHNGAYDWKVMHIYGICMNLVHDTLAMFKLSYWNLNRGMSLSLKSLANQFLLRDSFELKDFVEGSWGSNDIKFWDLPYESVKYYACPDTDNTLELYLYGLDKNLFQEFNMLRVYELEVKFSKAIAYQEFYGHCVDVSKLPELEKNAEEVIKEEEKIMFDMVGHEFNPRSSKDLPKVLYEELKYPILGYTDTGNPSCSKTVLKKLAEAKDLDGNYLYPLVVHLQEHKAACQIESNFLKVVQKYSTDDGYLFSSVVQFLETGRVSINNPNYQSYNDLVKHYIVPRPDFYMLDADYSSVEYRILSSMAGQMNLVEKFEDPDMDYHTTQASRMFNIPYELVSKKLRSQAKGINFGLPYGMGDAKLGRSIYGEENPENTRKAAMLRKKYFEGQEAIESFFINARADGVNKGYSETYFGRRRYFDKTKKNKGKIEREAGNARIQGTAADIYKIAMGNLLEEIIKRGWEGKVLISCFVHDECVIEVHKSIDPMQMLKLLRECMMLKIPNWCPLYTGAGFGACWYDAKKTEIPVQVQQMFVDKYGVTGLDIWDGDINKLYHWEYNQILEYKKGRVIDYLNNKDNWNKVIHPVENAFAHEVLEDLDVLDEGVIDSSCKPKKDPIDNLKEFCKAFGLDELFKQANILKPELAESSREDLKFKEDDVLEEYQEEDTHSLLKTKVNEIGFCMDANQKIIYIKLVPDNKVLMDYVANKLREFEGEFKVIGVLKDEEYEFDIKSSPRALVGVSQGYKIMS